MNSLEKENISRSQFLIIIMTLVLSFMGSWSLLRIFSTETSTKVSSKGGAYGGNGYGVNKF